ncbi:hypothetical protein [Peijinzhouia sedimentorum]
MKNLLSITLLALVMLACGSSDTVKFQGKFTKTIPGLTAADVHLNFTNKGFQLNKILQAEYSEWSLTKERNDYSQRVVAMGKSSMSIVNVQATNISYTDQDDIGPQFLSYVASLPYEGSTPQGARDWVLENYGSDTFTTISDVIFKLSSNGRVNTLTIERNQY